MRSLSPYSLLNAEPLSTDKLDTTILVIPWSHHVQVSRLDCPWLLTFRMKWTPGKLVCKTTTISFTVHNTRRWTVTEQTPLLQSGLELWPAVVTSRYSRTAKNKFSRLATPGGTRIDSFPWRTFHNLRLHSFIQKPVSFPL